MHFSALQLMGLHSPIELHRIVAYVKANRRGRDGSGT